MQMTMTRGKYRAGSVSSTEIILLGSNYEYIWKNFSQSWLSDFKFLIRI